MREPDSGRPRRALKWPSWSPPKRLAQRTMTTTTWRPDWELLAAIAASDALCCRLLGERSRGQNHRDAIGLLGTVRIGRGDETARARRARSLAGALATAIDLKDVSHYGMTLLEPPQVKTLMRAAKKLVDAAKSVVD